MLVPFRGRFLSLLCLLLLVAPPLHSQLPGPGTCIGFSAAGQHAGIPHHANLAPASAITIEGWYLPTITTPNCCANVLAGKSDFVQGMTGYQLAVSNAGDLEFALASNGNVDTLRATSVLSNFQWHHFAATYDGATMRIYVNGMERAQQAHTGNIAANMDSLFLAMDLRGEMDEVRFWDTALSESTLRAWMCKKHNGTHPNAANLRGYWKFDDVSGTMLTDAGPGGHDGLLSGGPMWGPSSVPLGDASVFSYGNSSPLQIAGPNGGVFQIDNWTNNPEGVHVYVVNQAPSIDTFQTGTIYYSQIDTSHYFGYFFVNGPLAFAQADVHYNYGGNPFFANHQECESAMTMRLHAAYPWWNPVFAQADFALDLLHYNNFGRAEFAPALMANPYGNLAIPGTEGCLYDTLLLLTGNGAGVTYQWYMDGNLIPNANDDSLWVHLGGHYQVYLTDSVCTYRSDSMEVVIHHLPQVGTPPYNLMYECEGKQDLMWNTVPPGGVWTGQGVVGDTFYVSQAGLGPWNLIYTVTDSNGCSNFDNKTVEVLVDLEPTFNISADSTCELSASISLAGLGNPPNGTYSGPGVSGQSFDPAAAGPGMHVIQYEIPPPAAACEFVGYDTITVLPAPAPPLINLTGDTLFSSDPNANWYLSAPTGDTYLGSGSFWVPTTSAPYYATTTDVFGCESLPSLSISVIVGLEAPVAGGITVYPNPADQQLYISQMSTGFYQVRIYSVDGKLVRGLEVDGQNGAPVPVNVNGLPAGVYSLELLNEWGNRNWARFVKK